MEERHGWRMIFGRAVLLLLVSFYMSVIWLVANPQDRSRQRPDAVLYERIAYNLLDGNGYTIDRVPPYRPEVTRTPVLPVVASLVLRVFGDEREWVLLFNALCIGLSLSLGYLAARQLLGNETAAWIGAWMALMAPSVTGAAGAFLTEPLAMLQVNGSVLLLLKWRDWKATRWAPLAAAGIGLMLALLVLNRPNFALAALVAGAWACLTVLKGRWRALGAWGTTAAMVVALGAPVLGWSARNASLGLPFAPNGIGGGASYVVEVSRYTDELLDEGEEIPAANELFFNHFKRPLSPKRLIQLDKKNRRWFRKLVRERWDRLLSILPKRFVILYSNDRLCPYTQPWPNEEDEFYEEIVGRLSMGLWLLALLGLVAVWRRRAARWVWLVTLGTLTVFHLLTISLPRYLVPVVPLIYPFGGAAVVLIWRLLIRGGRLALSALRRRRGTAVVTLLLLALWGGACHAPPPTTDPPLPSVAERPDGPLNVVLVVSDALRAASLPDHGYPRDNAPFLTRLAGEALVLARHHACNSFTPVSVTQMMTGRLEGPILLDLAHHFPRVRRPPPGETVLPAELGRLGYRTALVTSHPWFNERAPLSAHFEDRELVSPPKGSSRPYASFSQMWPSIRRWIDGQGKRRDDRPFFLYVHAMDTHEPFRYHSGFDSFRSARDWWRRYNPYDSEIAFTDDHLEKLWQRLQLRGLAERTVLVVTSDHGEEFNELGARRTDRNHGHTARRALVHVPLILKVPGAPPGRVERITSHLDLAPTILGLALGTGRGQRWATEGDDLTPALLAGEPFPERPDASVSSGTRFWGVHTRSLDVYDDRWTDEQTISRIDVNRYNYPVPRRVASLPSDAGIARWLVERRDRSRARLEALPLAEAPAGELRVGMPSDLPRGGGAAVTYDEYAGDDRWWLMPWMWIEAGPKEHPAPVTLGMDCPPGRYRVQLLLRERRFELGFRNGVTVRIGDGPELHVQPDGPDRGLEVDLGVYDIGRRFEVTLSDPKEGVSLAGFVLTPPGGQGPGTDADRARDEQLRRQLKALGYVE